MHLSFVMAGLVPAIHVFGTETWMPGTRPKLVDLPIISD